MGNIVVSKRIEASPAAVFGALTDIPNWADRVSSITKTEMLTDGPVGVGTRFRETRMIMKREATEEMEITAFEPGRSYSFECSSCGSHYLTDVDVRPDGAGTFVEMTMNFRAVTFMAKLMSPLGLLMGGMMRKCVEKDLDDIRTNLEVSSTATATA